MLSIAWSRVAAACYSARLTGPECEKGWRVGGVKEGSRSQKGACCCFFLGGWFVTQGVQDEHFWQVLSRCDLQFFDSEIILSLKVMLQEHVASDCCRAKGPL